MNAYKLLLTLALLHIALAQNTINRELLFKNKAQSSIIPKTSNVSETTQNKESQSLMEQSAITAETIQANEEAAAA